MLCEVTDHLGCWVWCFLGSRLLWWCACWLGGDVVGLWCCSRLALRFNLDAVVELMVRRWWMSFGCLVSVQARELQASTMMRGKLLQRRVRPKRADHVRCRVLRRQASPSTSLALSHLHRPPTTAPTFIIRTIATDGTKIAVIAFKKSPPRR